VNAQSVDQTRKLEGFIDALTAVLALQSVSSGCTCDHILSERILLHFRAMRRELLRTGGIGAAAIVMPMASFVAASFNW
jgi:hypothetical protein